MILSNSVKMSHVGTNNRQNSSIILHFYRGPSKIRYILNVSKETKIVDSNGARSYSDVTQLNPRVLANLETRESREARLEDSNGAVWRDLPGAGLPQTLTTF